MMLMLVILVVVITLLQVMSKCHECEFRRNSFHHNGAAHGLRYTGRFIIIMVIIIILIIIHIIIMVTIIMVMIMYQTGQDRAEPF